MTPKAIKAKEDLKSFASKIDTVLETEFSKEIDIAKGFTDYAVKYIKELKSIALTGGKRLRPSFVYYTYLLCGGEDIEEILKISTAIEIVHVFLLVEDDFMDIADTRRGYPTINKTFSDMHKNNQYKKEADHFGNSIAVNVGIIADHMAMDIFNNSNFDSDLKQKAQSQLNRQIIITAHGQIHDMLNEVRDNLTEQDIINVLYWKTGIYTYNNPIQIGAILAGATDRDLEILSKYAIPGGVAFQIQDDILGSFGNSDITGKSSDGDIMEGKQTLLTFKAYENASSSERQVLNSVLGNLRATEEEVDKVREIFVKTGALDYAKSKALELVLEAKSAITSPEVPKSWKQEGLDYLEGIADYMIDREL